MTLLSSVDHTGGGEMFRNGENNGFYVRKDKSRIRNW